MNSADQLVYMLNQMARNLATEADPVAAIANHITLFWDPRMKRQIVEHGTANLLPTAAAAVARLEAPHVKA
jgi:formate dehydrogenase subunit delta